jgi:hypothetical protein
LTGIERIEHLEGEVVDEAASGDLTATPAEGAGAPPESPSDSEN